MPLLAAAATTAGKGVCERVDGAYRRMSAELENPQVQDNAYGLAIVPVKDALDDSALDGVGSLTQQVYRLVRKLVIDLILLPNQFLSEKDVAASLDVSKTPVREAFIRLSEDGIVRIVPKSGTYVAPIDFDRAREGCFIWSALESSCAAQAAEQCSMRDIRLLRDGLESLKKSLDSGDAAGFASAGDGIHEIIYEAADLPDAKKLVDAARFEVDRVIHVVERYARREMSAVLAEFSDIVNAIARHDAEGARESMLRHMEQLERSFDSLMRDGELAAVFEFLNQKRPGTRRSRSDKKS